MKLYKVQFNELTAVYYYTALNLYCLAQFFANHGLHASNIELVGNVEVID